MSGRYFLKVGCILDEFAGTLDEAMAAADSMAAYTKTDMFIYADKNKEQIAARRTWYGVAADDEDKSEDIIDFGKFGFYAEWILE